MGRSWLRTLRANPDTSVVGVVDLADGVAAAAVAETGLDDVVVGTCLEDVLAASTSTAGVDAVVNVTVPRAHHAVNVAALRAGLPVLCEKPAAPDVATALRSAGAAALADRLLMVSQSRRYHPGFAGLQAAARRLGPLGTVAVDFFRAPHFGGFREQMEHVLLVDMAIHAFDAARHLIGSNPVAVHCEEWNPSYSWFRHGASAAATFEFADGARFTWNGSWCADGAETSWNGSWRVTGAGGTALWDGAGDPVVHAVPGGGWETSGADGGPTTYRGLEIAGALEEFVAAVRSGRRPTGHISDNLDSLLMVEAAVVSAETGTRVRLDEVFAAARRAAITAEEDPELLRWLETCTRG